MHDPMVVAHNLVLPLPRRVRHAELGDEKKYGRWGIHRRRRTNPENLGEPVYRFWRPAGWRVRLAGRSYGLYKLGTIWHVEPGGRDAFTVCASWKDGKRTTGWKWHVHHWSPRIYPLGRVKRWIVDRCAECGRRFLWNDARFGYMGGEDVYHDQCMSLRATRGQLDDLTRYVQAEADQTTRWRAEYRLKHLDEKAQQDA